MGYSWDIQKVPSQQVICVRIRNRDRADNIGMRLISRGLCTFLFAKLFRCSIQSVTFTHGYAVQDVSLFPWTSSASMEALNLPLQTGSLQLALPVAASLPPTAPLKPGAILTVGEGRQELLAAPRADVWDQDAGACRARAST